MNIKEHTTPDNLEKYSFLWSEVRLVIAALALFLGGTPPVFLIFSSYGMTRSLLTFAWIISGLASLYLLYRWNKGGKTVFGGKQKYDVSAFWIMIVSGLNLGIAGISGSNIGMSVSSNPGVFILVGIIYLYTAYHLHNRWHKNNKKFL